MKKLTWLEKLEAIQSTFVGRDDFYTSLILQEFPIWLDSIREGKTIEPDDVNWVIRRRGFNLKEKRSIRAMVLFLHENAKEIRRTEPIESKLNRFRAGWEAAARIPPCLSLDETTHFKRGFRECTKAKKAAERAFKASMVKKPKRPFLALYHDVG